MHGLISSLAFLTAATQVPDGGLILNKAVVLVPANQSRHEKKAVEMLLDEVRKRSQIRWEVIHKWPQSTSVVIAIGQAPALAALVGTPLKKLIDQSSGPKEGFRLFAKRLQRNDAFFVSGNDERGVLFGIGRLLRELGWYRGYVGFPREFSQPLLNGEEIASAPRYPLRGHQLGYRPKTNTYDAWDLPQWEQYIRDLAVFGTNAIELIPPRSDDAADSPHFPRPPMEMMIGMSQLADDYGLDVWIWYPAMDEDYRNPATVDFALKEWGEVFRKLPRVDAVFVPGGDPGHTDPLVLLALLEKQAANLRRYHPKAQMWVSPQAFSYAGLKEFCDFLHDRKPAWLTGVVHGPQVRGTPGELRRRIPEQYPIRLYPDITHSMRCQFPVPDWDLAFALTEGREVINPRPNGEAKIFHAYEKDAIGFITYSEGCNDDLNKMVWSSLGWNPELSPAGIVNDYARYFVGYRDNELFADGLLGLERNWKDSLLANPHVPHTLDRLTALEIRATPQERLNWRVQQALYRAYYDAYQQKRLAYEKSLEESALEVLSKAKEIGSREAMQRAETLLDRAVKAPVAQDLRARIFELAEALFQSIHMQLSVKRYHAIDVGRGANLDTVDVPLNDRVWLKDRFAEIRQLGSEAEKIKALEAIVHWTDPGPGGFYDDLGNPAREPHLVRGSATETEPSFLHTVFNGFGIQPEWRRSWCTHAETAFDTPLKMRYTGLDPHAAYKVRIVYGGNNFQARLRLTANEKWEVHPYRPKDFPVRPVEFAIPPEATQSGELNLKWTRDPGIGGSGRGCSVAEVWLIRK
jgi:hypothetical protein